jgi:DHA1 family solute carrier family 18 vesicular amine transporter 1/2
MSLRASRATAVAIVTLTTFTDILAYSIAVPVLPDLGRRLGASPTVIGLLFASFGLTVLAVSIPMGAASDRGGRKRPLVIGAGVLIASTLLFAYADSLPWLFGARLLQGAADAVAWVVGFALVADLYGPAERGRVMGFVMSGSNFGFMIGPTLGGWLYEAGGIRLPFLLVAVLAVVAAAGLLWVRLPERPHRQTQAEAGVPSVSHVAGDGIRRMSIGAALRSPAVRACAVAVVLAGGTIAMLEPVLSFFLSYELQLTPSRIGLVFGVAAVAATMLHPLFGHLADRWGARGVTLAGLVGMSVTLPLMSLTGSFETAAILYTVQAVAIAMVVTPSLAYMAEAMTSAGSESFGMAYGVYNFAWALGLLVGPAIGGFLYERLSFALLTIAWAPVGIAAAVTLARARNPSTTIPQA